jgi:hypothetical protein
MGKNYDGRDYRECQSQRSVLKKPHRPLPYRPSQFTEGGRKLLAVVLKRAKAFGQYRAAKDQNLLRHRSAGGG